MTTSESVATASAAAPAQAQTTPAPAPTASLYVGELNPEVTEAMLFEIFNTIGPVSSIRICRDAITRRSLGYGYVNFHNQADGERALHELNYTEIKGQPCRIMWSQRDPSIRRSGDGNVFIKNLDPAIDNKTLHDLFSAFGNILSCKVALDASGRSKGYGFVHFEDKASADASIEKLNGLLINDKKVYVAAHISSKDRAAAADSARAHFTNVFIKNLDESVGDEELKQMFAPFGTITSALVSRDEQSGRSKGFAFVNFESHESAEAACAALNGTEVNGRPLYVGRAQKKSEREEELRRQFEAAKQERLSKFVGVNLYVKNLAEGVDDEKLRQEFAPFGTITSCKVMCDDKGVSRGFGFVCYSSQEESTRAVSEMNGRMLAGKPLYVAYAQRKDERRQQLEAQHSARAQQLRYQQQLAAAAAAAGYPTGAMPPMFYPGAPMRFPPVAGGAVRPPMVAGQMRPPRPMRPMAPGQPGQGARMMPYARPPRPAPGSAMKGQAPRRPEPLTAAALAAATPEQQKTMLGERLFPLIFERQGELAGKITGMLLEIDNGELLHLLESPEALDAKVGEAVEVLRAHSAAQVQ